MANVWCIGGRATGPTPYGAGTEDTPNPRLPCARTCKAAINNDEHGAQTRRCTCWVSLPSPIRNATHASHMPHGHCVANSNAQRPEQRCKCNTRKTCLHMNGAAITCRYDAVLAREEAREAAAMHEGCGRGGVPPGKGEDRGGGCMSLGQYKQVPVSTSGSNMQNKKGGG